MTEKKTKKLVCNITGKTLFAASSYYAKKVDKAGSQERLHDTYVCREAKSLLKRGYSIDQIQQSLQSIDYTCTLTDDDIKYIIGSSSLRINNIEEKQMSIIKTDPEVTKFIQNILNDE